MSTARILFDTGIKIAPLTEAEKIKLELELEAEEKEHLETQETMRRLRVYISKEQIEKKMDELASKLATTMKGMQNVRLMTSLMGGTPFAEGVKNRLLKHGLCPKEDVICVSRYGENHEGGKPYLKIKPQLNMQGRNVFLLEDLIEGGVTIAYAKQVCEDLGAKSVHVVTLLDRVNQRVKQFEEIKPDFNCFVDDSLHGEGKWLIGRGLDENRRCRSLSWIGYKPSEADLAAELAQQAIQQATTTFTTPIAKM